MAGEDTTRDAGEEARDERRDRDRRWPPPWDAKERVVRERDADRPLTMEERPECTDTVERDEVEERRDVAADGVAAVLPCEDATEGAEG